MLLKFDFLKFCIENGKIRMLGLYEDPERDLPARWAKEYGSFAEVSVAGRDRAHHYGLKGIYSTESGEFRYVSHTLTEKFLRIVQESELVRVETVFERFEDATAVRAYSVVENITSRAITLEDVAALCLPKLASKEDSEFTDLYFYEFMQSHHAECQVKRSSFYDGGLLRTTNEGQKSIGFSNLGSWSTKERLPQGIIENVKTGRCLAFQIESNNAWRYEISDAHGAFYLYLTGASYGAGGWCKTLAPKERYQTASVAVALGNSLGGVLGELTKYRRHIRGVCAVDENLPTIFNEYMHLSWDSPTEERTKIYAANAAKLGLDYYVIDCGWHNEEPGDRVYPYVGQWKESKARFPSGLKKTTDYIRSLGMKAGLWIEPEVVGKLCSEMLAFYDDDCFLTRNGGRICVNGRYFLNFKNKKVVEYLNETIRRMVEDYGADYIKFDYNQDVCYGADMGGENAVAGLDEAANAYLAWVDGIRARFPSVLFETCSSGGLRMDYRTLSRFSIISTSDQTNYLNYPYIAGNVLAAVLPEQAAVWSYPVDSYGGVNEAFDPTEAWCETHISEEQIVMNMINSFLGRIHLASHIELLSERKLALVKDGLEYYKTLTSAKKVGVPYLPIGFTGFGKKLVASGLKTEDKIYLAVWNLGEKGRVEVPLGQTVKSVKIAYPKACDTAYRLNGTTLVVDFENGRSARFFEIEK